MVNIHSIPYNYTITISKQDIQDLFPDSLLARTMELDRETDLIEIAQECVTKPVLDVLKYILDNKTLPLIKPSSEFAIASRYLMIDVLSVLSDSKINLFNMVNLLDKNMIDKHYSGILKFCVEHKATLILAYVLDIIPSQEMDNFYIMDSIKNGNLDLLKIFVKHRSYPPHLMWLGLQYSVIEGHLDIVKYLVEDLHVHITEEMLQELFGNVCAHGCLDVAKYLLCYGQIDLNSTNKYTSPLWNACRHGKTHIVKWLLENPQVNPNVLVNASPLTMSIDIASSNGHVEIVKLLLQDPRLDPKDSRALPRALGNELLVKLLRKDGRFNPS